MRTKRYGIHPRAIMMALATAMMALAMSATTAFGTTVLDYDANRTQHPIADNITRLNVNKLEKGSRDYVAGAHLCIVEKETGRLVTEWVTDGSSHEIARNTGDKSSLNIDQVYILRELKAPDGYTKAADTEFVLHSNDEFNTTGEILSGPDAEFDVIRGHGDVQAFVINLYDEATVNVETVEYRRRTGQGEADSDQIRPQTEERQPSILSLVQTGDSIWYLVALGTIAAAIGIYLFRRRRSA